MSVFCTGGRIIGSSGIARDFASPDMVILSSATTSSQTKSVVVTVDSKFKDGYLVLKQSGEITSSATAITVNGASSPFTVVDGSVLILVPLMGHSGAVTIAFTFSQVFAIATTYEIAHIITSASTITVHQSVIDFDGGSSSIVDPSISGFYLHYLQAESNNGTHSITPALPYMQGVAHGYATDSENSYPYTLVSTAGALYGTSSIILREYL